MARAFNLPIHIFDVSTPNSLLVFGDFAVLLLFYLYFAVV
jgi:hypothetical protein